MMPDTLRERVTGILRDGVYDVSSLKRVTDAILAIFAEEREHLLKRVAHFKSDLALEEMSGRRLREELQARAEKAEAREAKLVEALEDIKDRCDGPAYKIACAALATVKEGK